MFLNQVIDCPFEIPPLLADFHMAFMWVCLIFANKQSISNLPRLMTYDPEQHSERKSIHQLGSFRSSYHGTTAFRLDKTISQYLGIQICNRYNLRWISNLIDIQIGQQQGPISLHMDIQEVCVCPFTSQLRSKSTNAYLLDVHVQRYRALLQSNLDFDQVGYPA